MVVIQAQNLNDLSDGSHYAGKNYVVVESWTPIYETKSKEVKSGVLDDNGHASFDLKMKNNRKYVLAIGQPNNVCYTELKFHSLNNEKSNNVAFKYAPCGYVIVPTNNVNCEGDDDKMQYRYYYSDDPDVFLYRGAGTLTEWSETTFVNGCVSYQGGFNLVPAGNYTFEWRVIRPSGTTAGTDTFYIGANDTTTYILEY